VHRHVFSKLPKWRPYMKAGMIWVRCPGYKGHSCGRPHREYLGPADRDEVAAELQFLRHEMEVAAAIIESRTAEHARPSPSHRRRTSR
jgi:hypothetical protein